MLEEFKINIRIKLAGLWTSVMFCYIYGDYFELYAPKKVQGLLDGRNLLNSPTNLFLATVMLTVPAVLIALCLFIKPVVCKWLNILLGAFFTLLMLLIAVGSISAWYSFYVFLAIVESILTATIVVIAFKWPKAH